MILLDFSRKIAKIMFAFLISLSVSKLPGVDRNCAGVSNHNDAHYKLVLLQGSILFWFWIRLTPISPQMAKNYLYINFAIRRRTPHFFLFQVNLTYMKRTTSRNVFQIKIYKYPDLSNPMNGNQIWNDNMIVYITIIAAFQTQYNINMDLLMKARRRRQT